MGEGEEIINKSGRDIYIGFLNITGYQFVLHAGNDVNNLQKFPLWPGGHYHELDDVGLQKARYIRIESDTYSGELKLTHIKAIHQ